MEREFIFYVSANSAPDRWPVPLPCGGWAHIRIEEIIDFELDVNDIMNPRNDESVMNTHTFQS